MYYKSNIQPTVATIPNEAEFMAAVSGSKAEKYISSILEEMWFSRKVPEKLFCDNTAEMMIENSNKPTERSRHINVQHFSFQEWFDIKNNPWTHHKPPKFI